jgi:hypothetical protein
MVRIPAAIAHIQVVALEREGGVVGVFGLFTTKLP